MQCIRALVPPMMVLLALAPGAATGQDHGGAAHHEQGPAPEQTVEQVPLYENLGDHHYAITTSVPTAQDYFDQGLRLYYAFNHAEAIRSFREAQRLDPECAMCFWGEALAWGPNINLPMDSASAVTAYEVTRRALAVREHAGEREQALIDALQVRYASVPPADRGHLDRAYAGAMAGVVERYPEDPEAAVLYAEALMDLRPWDYWTESGDPQPGIDRALAALEGVVQKDERHPGACHFFIHAVEKLYPERAVPCAERLADLMPGAGHLVHMPGHIYIRVGRYLDAVRANQHAVHADETYIRDQRPGVGMYTAGYYPHNYDFMAFATTMIGRGRDAVASAEKVRALIPEEMHGTPGMDFLQHWSTRPLQVRVRFARWDELLAAPAPPASRAHARGLWHYARGRALAATGDLSGAESELVELRSILASGTLDGLRMEFNASADLLAVAERVLTGWIHASAKRLVPAVDALREAVRLEDGLLYGEPPEWTVPTRHDLGAVLLLAARPQEAERTFREDLDRFPANGWSLRGLAAALRAQGRSAEAAEVQGDFERVWATADVDIDQLKGS
jgi:tetratricopeptide (TPR) repeat protein